MTEPQEPGPVLPPILADPDAVVELPEIPPPPEYPPEPDDPDA